MLLLFAVYALLPIGYYLYRFIKFRQEVNLISGPPVRSILLGNVDLYLKLIKLPKEECSKQFFQLLFKFYEKYKSKGSFRLWLGPCKVIYFPTSLENTQKLLNSKINVNKAPEYSLSASFFGDSIGVAKAPIWRHRRKLLGPGFHLKSLNTYLPIFAKHADRLLLAIETRKSKDDSANKAVLIDSLLPFFVNMTLGVVKETTFGDNSQEDVQANETYRHTIELTWFAMMARLAAPLHWIDRLYAWSSKGRAFYEKVDYLNDYAQKMINKRIDTFRNEPEEESMTSKVDSPVLVDYLLKCPDGLSDRSIQNEVNTIIFAGYDTTANALTFTTLMVGHHPTVQDTIQEELARIFGDNLEREITSDDLREMDYLEMVIKESLRLYPPALLLGRSLSEPLILENGQTIPRDSSVWVPITCLHRDSRYFPEPEQFLPERWAPGSTTSNQDVFFPFSSGPRNCLGQRYAMLEMKMALSSLFRQYRVRSLTDPEKIVRAVLTILVPVSPIQVEFTQINK